VRRILMLPIFSLDKEIDLPLGFGTDKILRACG